MPLADDALPGSLDVGSVDGRPRTDLVTDELLDSLVVAGDRDDLAAGLQHLASAGLGTAVVFDSLNADLPALLDAAQRAAEQVASGTPPTR